MLFCAADDGCCGGGVFIRHPLCYCVQLMMAVVTVASSYATRCVIVCSWWWLLWRWRLHTPPAVLLCVADDGCCGGGVFIRHPLCYCVQLMMAVVTVASSYATRCVIVCSRWWLLWRWRLYTPPAVLLCAADDGCCDGGVFIHHQLCYCVQLMMAVVTVASSYATRCENNSAHRT